MTKRDAKTRSGYVTWQEISTGTHSELAAIDRVAMADWKTLAQAGKDAEIVEQMYDS